MANTAALKEYLDYANENRKDFLANSIDSSNFISKVNESGATDYQKLLSQTTMSIKTMANAYYKSKKYLALEEIEKIKESLKNYKNDNERVIAFKNEIIDSLSELESNATKNHVSQLRTMRSEVAVAQRQIKELEAAKNKVVMERLASLKWPYNNTTKEIDSKIAVLTIKVGRNEQKIADLQAMPPVASEKDILMFQVSLKEKYGM